MHCTTCGHYKVCGKVNQPGFNKEITCNDYFNCQIIQATRGLHLGHRYYCSNCGVLAYMEKYCSSCGACVIENKKEIDNND